MYFPSKNKERNVVNCELLPSQILSIDKVTLFTKTFLKINVLIHLLSNHNQQVHQHKKPNIKIMQVVTLFAFHGSYYKLISECRADVLVNY